jgi:hypothetical protein
MDWIIAHAGSVEVLCGAAMAAWAFLSKLDKSFKTHLKEEFATKADFMLLKHDVHRITDKLDDILIDSYRTPGRRRTTPKHKKRSAP